MCDQYTGDLSQLNWLITLLSENATCVPGPWPQDNVLKSHVCGEFSPHFSGRGTVVFVFLLPESFWLVELRTVENPDEEKAKLWFSYFWEQNPGVEGRATGSPHLLWPWPGTSEGETLVTVIQGRRLQNSKNKKGFPVRVLPSTEHNRGKPCSCVLPIGSSAFSASLRGLLGMAVQTDWVRNWSCGPGNRPSRTALGEPHAFRQL